MKIFILMGGSSSEKNISIKTGNAVIKALSEKYDNVSPVIVSFDDNLSFLDHITNKDIVFNALHGGSGENGDLQSILELNNIIYTGSNSKASKICMDKHVSKLVTQSEGINTPDWILYKDAKFTKQKLFKANDNRFSYPYIVKPNNEGSTMGIAKVDNEDQLDLAISLALEFSKEIIMEEYISGREITVGILGNRTLPIVEIFPKKDFFDYECKYLEGMSEYKVPAKISKDITSKIQKDALAIHEAIGCRHYSRIDFILDKKGQHHFLEINSLPGMTSTSLLPMAAKNAGVEFDQLIDLILNMALLSND